MAEDLVIDFGLLKACNELETVTLNHDALPVTLQVPVTTPRASCPHRWLHGRLCWTAFQFPHFRQRSERAGQNPLIRL